MATHPAAFGRSTICPSLKPTQPAGELLADRLASVGLRLGPTRASVGARPESARPQPGMELPWLTTHQSLSGKAKAAEWTARTGRLWMRVPATRLASGGDGNGGCDASASGGSDIA